MTLREYISSKSVTLCFLGIGAILLAIFTIVGGIGLPLILTAEAFMILIVLIWLLCSWYLERKKILKLEHIQEELHEKYLLGEVLPPPTNAIEQQYFRIMKSVSRSAVAFVEQAKHDKEDYCDYVESWIHEIKTPLTACSLILDNDCDIRKLKRELKRADNLTESILYYARMKSAEKDTQIREFNISSVAAKAVKSQMELLVAAGISVEIVGDFAVYSDAKSINFILKQLLINCAKYCPGCQVTINAENGKVTVRDNGIGIPQHELTRITERGFTGTNGRRMGGSTGMGLYIANELCKRLDIKLTVDSVQGEYTSICLAFDSLTKV